MNNLPPLEINTNNQSFPLSILSGKGTLFEVINLSSLLLQIAFQNQGQIWQEARSKCIYPMIADQMGTQTVTISAFPVNPVIGYPTQSILCNVYQQGEIQWYAPVSLGQSEVQLFPLVTTGTSAGAGTITIPNNSDDGFIFLYGFDLTCSPATSATAGTVVIHGLEVGSPPGVGDLQYKVTSRVSDTADPLLLVRWNPPLASQPGVSPQFVLPGTTGGVWALNAYWTQSFLD